MRKCHIYLLLLLALLLAGPLAFPIGAQSQNDPALRRVNPELISLFDELVLLTRSHPWTPTQWARGIVVGVKLFKFGRSGIPYVGRRFAGAVKAEECFVAGAYMTVHGDDTDRWYIRRELETDKRKRVWLKAAFGSSRALDRSLKKGAQWQPGVKHLPSQAGCRLLARDCMASKDPLVRRAGIYWGYWTADGNYWTAAKRLAKQERDPVTRRLAAYLVSKENARK